jgi:hypothetical protein
MDQDGSLAISFDEWRDFLLYAPSTDIIEIINYWRHSMVSARIYHIYVVLEMCCCLCST